jgi:hypothetical protein
MVQNEKNLIRDFNCGNGKLSWFAHRMFTEAF